MGELVRPHWLKANERSEWPRHWIFFDCESRVDMSGERRHPHHMRLAWACRWRLAERDRQEQIEWQYATEADYLWAWVIACCASRTRLMVVSHNLVYDLAVTRAFHHLSHAGFELTTLVTERTCRILTWRRGTQTIKMIDSLNIWAMPLADLGADLGYPKLVLNPLTAGDVELSEYCQRDVEILLRAFQQYRRFLLDHDLGNLAPTAAGQAFNAYRHKHLRYGIYCHTDEAVISLERESYYGGRCEVLYMGECSKGPYYLLDVNSMYPHVMREAEYPSRILRYLPECTEAVLREELTHNQAIAEVFLETDAPVYPKRLDGRLVFPIGRFATVLPDPELRMALASGHVLAVGRVAIYRARPLFRQYVDTFYSLRRQMVADGNTAYALFCKLLLNSLYGKFGQRQQEWQQIGIDSIDRYELRDVAQTDGTWGQERSVAGRIEEKARGGNAWNAMVAIPACVTSAARLMLWRIISRAGVDNVLYCDTDSVIVNQYGRDNLDDYIDPTTLGMLRVECESYDCQVSGIKSYRIGKRERHMGIPPSAVRLADGTYQFEEWPGLATLLRGGDVNAYWTQTANRAAAREYGHGQVTQTGRVLPFQLRQDVPEWAVSLVYEQPELPGEPQPS